MFSFALLHKWLNSWLSRICFFKGNFIETTDSAWSMHHDCSALSSLTLRIANSMIANQKHWPRNAPLVTLTMRHTSLSIYHSSINMFLHFIAQNAIKACSHSANLTMLHPGGCWKRRSKLFLFKNWDSESLLGRSLVEKVCE